VAEIEAAVVSSGLVELILGAEVELFEGSLLESPAARYGTKGITFMAKKAG
jgi:hypothetical protein